MIYIALKNNKIIYSCETNSEQGAIGSLQYDNISDYDEIKQIPNDYFQGKVGNDIREFDSKFELLPLSQRIDYIEIPEGKKIENNESVDMTLKEKITSGLIEIGLEQKYDDVSKSIISKTDLEKANEGLITILEYKAIKENEINSKFEDNLENGYFDSTAIGIKVDCRRSGKKNDKQNVEGLISHMVRKSLNTVDYVGYSETISATKDDLKILVEEMEDYVLMLYQKKWTKLYELKIATKISEIDVIKW